VARQLEVQLPTQDESDFAPNRGRKVLIFSDSRQVAARLAPQLQTYATQDLLRPLLVVGFTRLTTHPTVARKLSLRDAYLATLTGAALLGVVLRPEIKPHESFAAFSKVRSAIKDGVLGSADALNDLREDIRDVAPPESLLAGIHVSLTDGYYGLQALALGFLKERDSDDSLIGDLPPLGQQVVTSEQKAALVRMWLSGWRKSGIWFPSAPAEWMGNKVRSHTGRFAGIKSVLPPSLEKQFSKDWLEILLKRFCDPLNDKQYRLLAANVGIGLTTAWAYCSRCKTVDVAFPGVAKCLHCGAAEPRIIDPNTDDVFVARKGYYRRSTVAALKSPPEPPLSIVAAEHTAQIGTAQEGDIYSLAEEHELLFQDVDLGRDERGQPRPAIDVLSCTTTMEVGIDIGQLSGVALRNMPPARANYQQRAGRAGRRGTSVASVIALAGADSHDNHFFDEPDELIRGQPADPSLTLDNAEIARRHLLAFLLQGYLMARLPVEATAASAQLFEVLGSIKGFLDPSSPINREDFATWLAAESVRLKAEAAAWLPAELAGPSRQDLISAIATWPLEIVDSAIAGTTP
jgi:Lhr-like helicase